MSSPRLTSARRILLGLAAMPLFPLLTFAAPTIRNLQHNSSQVPQYEKFELTFEVDTLV